MKKTILITLPLILAAFAVSAQKCSWGTSKAATVTAGVVIDWSLKQYEPSGFYGLGVHGGIWADHIGIFAGYVEAKLNEVTPAVGVGAFTIATRYTFLKEDRLVTSVFFSAGTKNYVDFGVRVGYDIWNNNIATGIVISRMQHYGIGILVSMGSDK